MLKYYFLLSIKRFHRKFIDFGAASFVLYPILLSTFLLASWFFFNKTDYSPFFYLATPLLLGFSFSEDKKKEFLIYCFGSKKASFIRYLECLLLSLPFSLYLLFESEYLLSLLALPLSILPAWFSFKSSSSYTIPTPFTKKSFELIAGFRKSFFLFPILYLLDYIAISVDNFGLGIFSLVLLFFVFCTTHLILEPKYYLWSFNLSPKSFLRLKVLNSIQSFTLYAMPIVLPLCVFFMDKIYIVLPFIAMLYLFLLLIVLSSYTSYPSQRSIPYVMLIVISFIFPPLLLFTLPYFYYRSILSLNEVLS